MEMEIETIRIPVKVWLCHRKHGSYQDDLRGKVSKDVDKREFLYIAVGI